MCDQIRFFAGAARNLEGKSAGTYMDGMLSIIVREPVGVCAAVTPWNYPMMMAVWKWAPCLAAGNCMVLKPSETTPISTLLMAKIMGEVLPPGVFNVVCGEKETGAMLVGQYACRPITPILLLLLMMMMMMMMMPSLLLLLLLFVLHLPSVWRTRNVDRSHLACAAQRPRCARLPAPCVRGRRWLPPPLRT